MVANHGRANARHDAQQRILHVSYHDGFRLSRYLALEEFELISDRSEDLIDACWNILGIRSTQAVVFCNLNRDELLVCC